MKSMLNFAVAAIIIFSFVLSGCGSPNFREFKSEQGKFSISFPGNPKMDELESGGEHPVKMTTYTAELKKTGFIVAYIDSHEGEKKEVSHEAGEGNENNDLLSLIRIYVVNSFSGTLISNKEVTLADYKGLEFTAKGKKKNEEEVLIAGRVFVIKGRVFQIYAFTQEPEIPDYIHQYLESFKLN